MKTGITVQEAMTQNPVTVLTETPIDEIAKTMAENHVGGVLVKSGDDIIGIITEQDIVRKCVINDCRPSENKAESLMETGLAKVAPEDDIREAIEKMGKYNVRHMPVFADNNFVGLITTKDILKIQPQLFEILATKIELKEEERKPINVVGENEGICESCGNYDADLVQHEGTVVCQNCKDNM